MERVDKGKRLIRCAPTILNSDHLVAWLVEAVLRYKGKAMSIPALQSMPVIYPFALDRPIAYVASNSPPLELRSEGTASQYVAMRDQI